MPRGACVGRNARDASMGMGQISVSGSHRGGAVGGLGAGTRAEGDARGGIGRGRWPREPPRGDAEGGAGVSRDPRGWRMRGADAGWWGHNGGSIPTYWSRQLSRRIHHPAHWVKCATFFPRTPTVGLCRSAVAPLILPFSAAVWCPAAVAMRTAIVHPARKTCDAMTRLALAGPRSRV